MHRILSCFLVFSLLSFSSFAGGIDRSRFQPVYNFVSSLGPMDGYLLKDIVDTFKAQNYEEAEMTYAIYAWISKNISYDCKALHQRKQANFTASHALQTRKAIGEGYANLFQAMCDLARIKCVTISGLAKSQPTDIYNNSDKQKHAWNAVSIQNTWYYVDASWGAGFTDVRRRMFTKEYSDAWFFTNRTLFALSHYPDEKKWHFEDVQVTKSLFMNAPIIRSAAAVIGVLPFEDTRGRLRGRTSQCKPIVFEATQPQLIKHVAVEVDGQVSPAEYSIYEDELLVEVPLLKSGKDFVTVLINSKPAFVFKTEVAAVQKR